MNYPRYCDTCGKGMHEGFYHLADASVACSEKCWFTEDYTQENYEYDYDNGEAGYTTWEDGEENV